MQQQKSKKLIIYIFFLIFLGSINNLNFNETTSKKIININIIGLSEIQNNALTIQIEKLNLENIFFINAKELDNIFSTNSIIHNYKIFKNYPSTLNVEIQKTKFLAKINENGKIYIIGSNGKFLKNNPSIENLPFIFGKPKIQEFLDLKTKVDKSKIPYDQIKNLFFFQSKRWDLQLINNITIKLSKDNTIESMNFAYDFLRNNSLLDYKTIDVRVKNQIIVNG